MYVEWIGCTGVVDNAFVRYLGKIPAEINIFELQKIVLLHYVLHS